MQLALNASQTVMCALMQLPAKLALPLITMTELTVQSVLIIYVQLALKMEDALPAAHLTILSPRLLMLK